MVRRWKNGKSEAKCRNHGNQRQNVENWGKSKFSPTGVDPRRMSCRGTGRRRWEIFSMSGSAIFMNNCIYFLFPRLFIFCHPTRYKCLTNAPGEAVMENSTLPTFGMQQCIQIVYTCAAYRAESMQEHIVSHWSIAEKGRKMRQKSTCTMMMMMVINISFVGLVGTGRWVSAREGESCTSVWSWLL